MRTIDLYDRHPLLGPSYHDLMQEARRLKRANRKLTKTIRGLVEVNCCGIPGEGCLLFYAGPSARLRSVRARTMVSNARCPPLPTGITSTSTGNVVPSPQRQVVW